MYNIYTHMYTYIQIEGKKRDIIVMTHLHYYTVIHSNYRALLHTLSRDQLVYAFET